MSSTDSKNIRAMMIIEVLGKPPEHLKETLNDLINKIDSEDKVNVIEKKINEPVELKEENKGFYTSFAEVEIEVEQILDLAMLVFKYMPAHIEVIEPEVIALTNNSWGEILSELVLRLHKYDEVARILGTEKRILEKRLKEMSGN